jgi:hypothetical protein
LEDEMRKEEKLQWIGEHGLEKIEFESVFPDKNNDWINLVAVHPENGQQFLFKNEHFEPIDGLTSVPEYTEHIDEIIVSTNENLPVYIIK